MPSYQEAALNGDPLGVVQQALLLISFWAIATTWTDAIRTFTVAILDPGSLQVSVAAEVASACLTTFIAVCITAAAYSFKAIQKYRKIFLPNKVDKKINKQVSSKWRSAPSSLRP